MNPFINTEFWLGLAFFIVLGLLIFSPIRRVIQKSLLHQKNLIQDKINQSNAVYKEALKLHQETLKNFKNPSQNQEIKHQVKTIKQEFLKKKQVYTENKNQNFQIQKMLLMSQTKNHLRTQLLQMVTHKILNFKRPKHPTSQEVQHFIKMLNENKDSLNQNL